jgi:hypothetical protein
MCLYERLAFTEMCLGLMIGFRGWLSRRMHSYAGHDLFDDLWGLFQGLAKKVSRDAIA